MDDFGLDLRHTLDLDYQEQRRDQQHQTMGADESGNMQKHKNKRPMRGLRAKARKRNHYDH